jgi:uncharacterized protein
MSERSFDVAGSGSGMSPRRSCVVCRAAAAKATLHRIVRDPTGSVGYDPTGKAPGRGAYLCGGPACLQTAGRRRSLQQALRVNDTAAVAAAVESLRTALTSGAAHASGRRREPPEEVRTG